MSEQDVVRQVIPMPHPTNDDQEAWREYWELKDQEWRQKGVGRVTPMPHPTNDDQEAWKEYWKAQGQEWRTEPEIDAERQKYLDERRYMTPTFEQRDFPFKDIKLSRADVEWLIATQKDGIRLNLYCADLRGVALQGLPLYGAILDQAHLEESSLAHLDSAVLAQAYLEGAMLNNANIRGANLFRARMSGARINKVHLEGSVLIEAQLEGATLYGTHLEGTLLSRAHLEGADLVEAHLEGADLSNAHLDGSFINGSFFNSATKLGNVHLGDEKSGFISVAGVHWGDVDLSVVDWTKVKFLGDEHTAQQPNDREGKPKTKQRRSYDYQTAVRAYRQLATVLRNQGLNEDATRFAYRAQLMQRKVYWYQRKNLQYLGSLSLDLLAGYGYRFKRSFLAYLIVIGIFAALYFHLGAHLAWNEAIVISMTAFHGRGFFPDQFHPGDPQALVAAIEAFVGLLIEVTFIATLTQRLFGK